MKNNLVNLKLFVVLIFALSLLNGEENQVTVMVQFKPNTINIPIGESYASIDDFSKKGEDIKNYLLSLSNNITLKKSVPEAKASDTLFVNKKGKIVKVPDFSQLFRLTIINSNKEVSVIINDLKKIKNVVDIDYLGKPVFQNNTPDDLDREGRQWSLHKINAEQAWNISTSGAVIGIIDDGIMPHEDIGASGRFGNSSYGLHGLGVAGIAGARTDNNLGLASLGYNQIVVNLPFDDYEEAGIRIIEACSPPSNFDPICDIINCSFTTNDDDGYAHSYYYVYNAIQYALARDKIIVASTGNIPVWYENNVVPYNCFPASYSGVVGVSAVDSLDNFPAGYNYGNFVDLCAPGIDVRILATNYNKDDLYVTADGTSYSAPMVCALAGLLVGNGNLDNDQIITTLELSAVNLDSSQYYGSGRIDAYEAVRNIYIPQVYSNLDNALSELLSGQRANIKGSYTLSGNQEVTSGEELFISKDAELNMQTFSLTTNGGTIDIEYGANISPYICVKESGVIKGLYPNITEAAAATTAGQVIELNGKILTDIVVPSGETVVIESTADIDMNGKTITTTSGTINVNYSAKIDPFIVYKKTNGSIAGLYSNLSNAVSAVTPFNDETVEINSAVNVNSNVTIPLESTLKIMTNARLDIGSSYKITKPSISSLVIDGTPELNPDIRLKSGTTLLGLYASIASAFSDGSYVETRDTISLSDHLAISTGKTLSVKSGSKYFLPSGKYLNVSGTLNATSATFTKASTSWGGIKYLSGSSGSLNSCSISNSTYGVYFNSSNPSIDDCTISNSSYGVYCTGASPDIENCTISNCSTYGLYAYNASPYLETNSISNSLVYMNNCSSELYDNLIVDGDGSYFVYIYDSAPILDNNTISTEDAMIVIYTDNGSTPVFGGGGTGIPTGGIGLNELFSDDADFVVLADDGSYVLLGTGGAGAYVPRWNTIIGGAVFPVGAIDATIEAQYCWWGSNNEPGYFGEVNVENYLEDEPPTIDGYPGSSLAKALFSPEPIYASSEEASPEKALMNEAKQKEKDGEYTEAILIYKSIIIEYEDSKYANQALMKALKLYRKYEIAGAETFLDELIENVSDETLLGYVNARKVSHYRKNGELNKAIKISEEIVENYSESVRENTSLFDLFNFYHKELNDMKKAEKYLDELKMKYPENYLTIIARSDMGEDVSDVQLTKPTYNEKEITEEIIIPEAYELKAAAPNPFNPSTTLEYALPVQSSVKCTIYDIAGNLINEYNYDQSAGNHKIKWNGSEVSSGIYLIRFVAEASDGSEIFVDYQKVTFLK